jgi:sigma-B regulation protein RsbU (phosphoserine phosphatase)
MLSYSSAGHPPPRLVRGKGIHRLNAACGLPLGVEKATVYESATMKLLPGDRLVLFTDGLTESTNAAGRFFSDSGLEAVLSTPASTAQALLETIVDSVRAFRAGQPAGDDETCLVGIVTSVDQSTLGRRRERA